MWKFNLQAYIFILCVLYTVIFYGCQKEYSYEGASGTATGTAVYTMNGAGNSCTDIILAGEYFAGVAMVTQNSVKLNVNVIAVGTFNISTNSINGIKFTAVGTFIDSGMQAITLMGLGSPVATGNFNFTFIPPIGLGCSFTVNITHAPPVTAAFTLAGTPGNCLQAAVNGNYVSGIKLENANTVDIRVNVSKLGAFSITSDTLQGISFFASGMFSDTGNQMVTLKGNGVPENARNLTFTILSATSSCSFLVAIANPEPQATYVLESGSGNPNLCIYTLKGIYLHNTAIPDSNYVSIRVYVTATGNFTIATNTINGMSFSLSGTFVTTRPQTVLLKGMGIPLALGTYAFAPQIVGPHPLGGEACTFYAEVQ